MKNIREIVKEKLFSEGKTIHAYAQYLRYACDGLKRMEYFSTGGMVVRTEILEVDSVTNTIQLPPHFVDLSVIGIKHGNTVINLGSKDNLLLTLGNNSCGIPIENVSECCSHGNAEAMLDGSGYAYNAWVNGYPAPLYGFTGGYSAAYYRIDLANKQIVLDGNISTGEIIIEFLSDLATESSVVNAYCEFALKAYIDWQAKENRRNETISARQLSKQEWEFTCRSAKLRINSFTMHDFIKRNRRSNTQTVKL